ncbi:MAG: hypothetical protein Kow0042_11690 [Calditrichia bacterium]
MYKYTGFWVSLLVLFAGLLYSQELLRSHISESFHGVDPSAIVDIPLEPASDNSQKIDPLLRYVLIQAEANEESLERFREKFSSQNELISVTEGPDGSLRVAVFVKSTDIQSTMNAILADGGTVSTISGDILVSQIPWSKIEALAGRSEVEYLEAGSKSQPKLDVSHVEIGVNAVHAGTGLPQSYKGSGVVVGVVDSGIDWQHEDFDNGSGTRIQYLWDMSGTGNPPSGYTYGTEYTKAQIDAGQCNEIDGDDGGGHGTHVSATAAGKDNALAGYTGMAPEADIVFVKGFRSGPGFANTDVVDGCNYIFQKAQAMSAPAVINLSLGGHFGAHDGTSLYEQSLSNMTGPGKIIVAAAGNEGSDLIHLSYATGGANINEARQTFWYIPPGTGASYVDMWYTPGNISVGIAAYDTGLNFLGATNPVAPGQAIQNQPFVVGSTTLALVSIDAQTITDPNNGDSRVVFVIDSDNGTYNLNAVWWVLYTFGSGTFDAWMVTGGSFTIDSNPSLFIMPGDNDKSIGMPGTSQKLICVGSYVTKNQWIDVDGTLQTQPGNPTIGDISSFSSHGPSRDNRLKPDLAAPGEVIVAALSSNVTIGPNNTPRSNVLQGGKHQKMQGTSMASPHVTGTVALMLQRNSTLDYTQVFNILTTTTVKDGFTGTNPNNTFGNGKLNALNAVQATPGGGGPTPVTILAEGFDFSPFPPSGWTQQILNTNNTWIQGNPQNNNFNQIDPTSQSSAICPWVAQNQDEWLITPQFSLGDGTASLEFYAGYSTQWLTSATLKLHISTDGGSSWSQLWEAENDGQSWMWRQKMINLSPYVNQQNLKLAWQYVGNDGDLVGLDGVKLILTPPTGIEVSSPSRIPVDYTLSQNYPNPFNPSTTIEFALPVSQFVTLKIFNILGEEVSVLVAEQLNAGSYRYHWDARNLATGVYYYQLKAGDFVENRKMMLIR